MEEWKGSTPSGGVEWEERGDAEEGEGPPGLRLSVETERGNPLAAPGLKSSPEVCRS